MPLIFNIADSTKFISIYFNQYVLYIDNEFITLFFSP